jgi:hypothetical protein
MLASVIAVVFLVVVMGLCGHFTAQYAAERGRSRRAWFIWGALFSPLFPAQWFVLALLPKK